ncbi:MAG TPA: anti-sigma factor [Gemmatimonadaceae bacterium]
MSDDETNSNNERPQSSTPARPADEIVSQQPDATTPAAEVEPRFDVAGAALGALDRSEEADLYAAAATDPAVSAELAAMESVAAELARLAPVRLMNRGRSAGIRSRLVARAAGSHLGRPVSRAVPPIRETERPNERPDPGSVVKPATVRQTAPANPRAPASTPGVSGSSPARRGPAHFVPFEPPSRAGLERILGLAALAAVLVIAAFGLYNWRTRSTADKSNNAIAARDSSLEAQVASLRASVAQKDSLIDALTGMRTRVIDLVGYNSIDPMARMFWDQKTQMFIMYASHVKQPAAGKTYQVWLIARGVVSPVSAGTFLPDSSGSAVMAVKHPMEPGTLRRIAVTEEPMGGMPSPTGPIVFAGVGR